MSLWFRASFSSSSSVLIDYFFFFSTRVNINRCGCYFQWKDKDPLIGNHLVGKPIYQKNKILFKGLEVVGQGSFLSLTPI